MYREVTEMHHCGSCGKLLSVGGKEAERFGRTVLFCSDECLAVFDTYKVPKYGEEALWAEAVVR